MTSGRFKILALTGGGYLGFYTASALAGLEARLQRPLAAHFDLISGTSVGGIIALGLAAGVPAARIVEAFESDGQKIFPERARPKQTHKQIFEFLRLIRRPKHDSGELRRTVDRILGPGLTMADLQARVLIPTFNLSRGLPELFRTPHAPDADRHAAVQVADVALATAAAPLYFPTARINGEAFVDGGVFASAPDLLALNEALSVLGQCESDVWMLSVGTTSARFAFDFDGGAQPGLFGWAREQRLVRVMLAAQQSSTADLVGARLGARYIRLDAEPSVDQALSIGLDIATPAAKAILESLAERSLADCRQSAELAALLDNATRTQ